MAIENNPGVSITDMYGTTHTNLYGVIDIFISYDKRRKLAEFYVDIYATKAHANDDAIPPLRRIPATIQGDDFDTHLAPAVIAANGDQYKKAYLYIMGLGPIKDRKGEVVFDPSEWASDE